MVQCRECGYLAVRNDQDGGKVFEATELVRCLGIHCGMDVAAFGMLFCYRRSPAFPPEPEAEHAERVRLRIAIEIQCDQWARWWPGRTPAQHEEMTMLDVERRERERDRDECQRRDQRTFNLTVLSLALSTAVALVVPFLSALLSWYISRR